MADITGASEVLASIPSHVLRELAFMGPPDNVFNVSVVKDLDELL